MIHAHRREAGGLDELEVPATALHIEQRFLFTEEIFFRDLDRGVAAAVQDQRLVAPEQTRGVDAQSQITREWRGFLVVPEAFHGMRGGNPRIVSRLR